MIRIQAFLLCLLLLASGVVISPQSASAQIELPAETIVSVAWSPDGNRIATGHEDGTLKIWDAGRGEALLTWQAHNFWVRQIDWSPDGLRLVSGGLDGYVHIWQAISGQNLAAFTGKSDIGAVEWSPDGDQLMAISAEGNPNLQIWDASSYQLIFQRNGGTINDIDWSPDHSKIALAHPAGRVYILDALSFQWLSYVKNPEPMGTHQVVSVDWSPDGTRVVGGESQSRVRIWDVGTSHLLYDLQGNESSDENWPGQIVVEVSYNAEGSVIAGVSGDGTLRTWNANTGQVLETIQLNAPIHAAAWNDEGSALAYGGDAGILNLISAPYSFKNSR